jgi:hypothetical protein
MESLSRCSGCEQAAFCVGLHEGFLLHCQSFSLSRLLVRIYRIDERRHGWAGKAL